MGRFSSRLAPVFADFAGVEPGMRALDVGAGTGALTAELVRRDAAAGAIEPSPAFVAGLARFETRRFHEHLAQVGFVFPKSTADAGEEGRAQRCRFAHRRAQHGQGGLAAASQPLEGGGSGVIQLGADKRPQCFRPLAAVGQCRHPLQVAPQPGEIVVNGRRRRGRAPRGRGVVRRLRGPLGHAPRRGRPGRGMGSGARRRAAHGCARGVVSPAGRTRRPVHAHRPRLGGARYARVRTLSRSAPVPTSVTATSSSRSTKST